MTYPLATDFGQTRPARQKTCLGLARGTRPDWQDWGNARSSRSEDLNLLVGGIREPHQAHGEHGGETGNVPKDLASCLGSGEHDDGHSGKQAGDDGCHERGEADDLALGVFLDGELLNWLALMTKW
jgi:hypothetical protein